MSLTPFPHGVGSREGSVLFVVQSLPAEYGNMWSVARFVLQIFMLELRCHITPEAVFEPHVLSGATHKFWTSVFKHDSIPNIFYSPCF